MQPADDIRRLIDEARITPSPQVDRRLLADALEDLEKRRQERAACPRPAVWRIVMRSKMTKLAVAAAIVAAVLIALPFFSPFGSTVTFAQAIQPILNANSAILDIIMGEEKEGVPVIHDMIMGSRIRRSVGGVSDEVSIIDLQTMRVLSLAEAKKEAVYIDLKGLPQIPNYLDNLKNVFTELQNSPHFAIEDLGTRQIDGREAVGFLAKHPRAEITLWADAKTGLPVRIEQKEGQLNVVVKNLQFDVPMEDALFSMDVPEGYHQQQVQLDLFGATEADFIAGLRILAEKVNDGQFPAGVSVDDYLKQGMTIQKRFDELGLSTDEQTALGMSLSKHLLFLRFYKGEGKWYYRGQGVKLGEAEKAIFWYRPKDSRTYRVIYGDLHVEDVAPENLPEPLDADDVVTTSVEFQQWSRPEFVGTQEDLWHIPASGPILVQSDVTLMKGPQGTSIMPISLPYDTGVLTAVTLGDAPVPFQQTGPGQYNLQLPLDKLLAGQSKMTCQWTLVLADLEKDGTKVPLKSLVPVVSYKLTVAPDPGSGWECVKDPSQASWVPFSIGNPPQPGTNFGTCGLGMQKRK
jgi:hypothetical protein